MFNDKCRVDSGFPAANAYLPTLKMVQPGGYGKIMQGLGYGKKKLMHN
jgi:hypothetical protein